MLTNDLIKELQKYPKREVKILLKQNIGTESDPEYDDYRATDIQKVEIWNDCFPEILIEAINPFTDCPVCNKE